MCVWSLLQGRNSWIVSWTRVRSWSPRTVLPLNYQGRKLVGGHKRYNGGESLCTWRGLPKVFWGLLAFHIDWGEVNTPATMARANNLELFCLSIKNAWFLSGGREESIPWAPLSYPTTATQPSSGHLYLWRGTRMFLVHSLGRFWFILVQWLSGEIQKRGGWKFPRWGRLEVLLLLVTQQQLFLHLWSSNCRPLGTDEENDLQSGEVTGPAESPSVKCLHREEERVIATQDCPPGRSEMPIC